ncbi:MAG: fibronectin type III domain-containing protein [Eubacterium sp.]|nr:fibronectin type III domain-containing protein [Eubacterium sp.]
MKKVISVVLSICMLLSITAGLEFSANANDSSKKSFNGHTYQIFDDGLNWFEAKAYCNNIEGHLVSITSKAEQDFLYTFINENGKKETYWIGATDEDNEGVWTWITGETFNYSNWDYGEPNDDGDYSEYPEDYAELIKSSGLWNDGESIGDDDIYSLDNHGFICEWDSEQNNNNSSRVCLADLECVDEGHYEDNQGDARLYKLDGSEFKGYAPKGFRDQVTRNGNIGVNGEVFENGFEVWIARWNFGDNISWAYRTFKLEGKYHTLTGSSGLINSYNTKSFDVSAYFYAGDRLIYSFRMTPDNYNNDFSINVENIDELKVEIKDNIKAAGGTSFALYNLMLSEKGSDNDSLSLNEYIRLNVSHYYDYIMSKEGPAGPLMSDAWDVNKLANAFVQSSSHLFNGKTTDQSIQEYYDAVLFDLIANTYTLPDFDSYMEKQFDNLQNSIINYFIGKGFELTSDISNSSNFGLFYDYIEDLMGTEMSSYELTYELINSMSDGCDDALECINLLSQYILIHEQGKELESALNAIQKYAYDGNFKKAIDDVIESLSMTPQQYIDKIVAEKMTEYGLTLVEKVAEKIVKDVIVKGFNKVFPLAEIKLIVELTSYLCDTFFATTVNSNQQYRLYIYVKIENACKEALQYSYYYGTASEVASCYEMFIRIFEHEIRECLNFADIYYNQGLFNQVKNFMNLGGGSYENAVDWINSYKYPLNNLITIKTNAQKQWGLNTGELVHLYEICMFDGMIAGFKESIIDAGYKYYKLSDEIIESFIHNVSGKDIVIDSVYFDAEMKNEVQQFPITINENTALYYNFFEVNHEHIHDYKNILTKATVSQNGYIVAKCDCGDIKNETVIYRPETIKLSKVEYVYNGKVKKPTVTVKDSKGKTISPENYTVSYANGRKNVGTYTVKITFKGNYKGTKNLNFMINPKTTSLSGITAKSKGFTVKWNKQATQTTGYEIQYATDSKFTKNKKTVTVSKNSTTSKTISKLKAKKKYYVRIRTYKSVSGTKYYSSWSKSKSVTTKK